MPLKVAAKVDPADRDYSTTKSRPCWPKARMWNFSARSMIAAIPISWVAPGRCVSHSWPNRSACDDRKHGLRHAGDRLDSGAVPEVLEDGLTGYW